MITGLGLMILCIPCGIIDWKKKELPMWYIGIFSATGCVYTLASRRVSVMQMLLGASIGLLCLIVSLISKNRFGFGDGVILGAVGIWAGGEVLLEIMLRAFFLVVIIEGVMVLMKKRTMQSEVAFVPFLSVSCLVQWILGPV